MIYSNKLEFEGNQLRAEICFASADPRRILRFYFPEDKSSKVSGLAAEAGISPPADSRHLKILRDCSLAQPVREGQRAAYRLRDKHLIQVLNLLRADSANNQAYLSRCSNDTDGMKKPFLRMRH